MRIEPLPYDPRLAFSLPAWVIENIQAVSTYMKTRGHEEWTIAGVRSQAAHAREVDAKDAYIREADRRISVLASLLNQSNADRLREVEALRLRAEAAENAMRTIASTQEGRMAIAKAIHIELDKVDEWLDAAMLAARPGKTEVDRG